MPSRRLVLTMARSLSPLVVFFAAASASLLAAWAADSPEARPAPAAPAAAAAVGTRIGIESCVARGCHGSVGGRASAANVIYHKGGEATTWRTYDPHARAYSVLLSERSKQIARLLGPEIGGLEAHKAKLCLDCHSVGGAPGPDRPQAEFASGVDCETCHGPASAWVEPHVAKAWTDLKPEAKQAMGFRLTKPLADRGRLCAGCHIGDGSREVNHDLMAAGHPELTFELDAFLDQLPAHWVETSPEGGSPAADFHARAWVAGQVAATEATVELVKHRAERAVEKGGRSCWPEFTEYDCFSCHHDLKSPTWRPTNPAGRPAGTLSWGSPTLPNLQILGGLDPTLVELRTEMQKTRPSPAVVAKLAAAAEQALKAKGPAIVATPLDKDKVKGYVQTLIDPSRPPDGWEDALARGQAALALAKAYQAMGGDGAAPLQEKVDAFVAPLAFPRGVDSPKNFHP